MTQPIKVGFLSVGGVILLVIVLVLIYLGLSTLGADADKPTTREKERASSQAAKSGSFETIVLPTDLTAEQANLLESLDFSWAVDGKGHTLIINN